MALWRRGSLDVQGRERGNQRRGRVRRRRAAQAASAQKRRAGHANALVIRPEGPAGRLSSEERSRTTAFSWKSPQGEPLNGRFVADNRGFLRRFASLVHLRNASNHAACW